MRSYHEVIDFWFHSDNARRWFIKEEAFDQKITQKFLDVYEEAIKGYLISWENTPESLLSLIILLDQFPRQMFRNQARAFFSDPLALALTKKGLALEWNQCLTQKHALQFFYMPLMHSESLDDQELALKLFTDLGDETISNYAKAHHAIIARFGRFPHRNSLLQRASTPEERAFLKTPGSTF